MRIIRINLEHPYQMKVPVAACIGYFDGLHLGHQALIKKTNELAAQYHCESALITFDPDPWVTIRHETNVKHLSTMRQRINKSVSLGIKNIFILEFSEEMSQLSPHDFCTKVLGSCNLKALVCGFDFHYGIRGEGNPETLAAEHQFEVAVIPAVEDEKGKISSTRISNLITEGHVSEAGRLLGSPYELEGTLTSGNHIGTGLGFPTANISVSSEYILPLPGVYACYVLIHGVRYQAMVNFGHNPTLNYTKKLSLEAFILNFHQDIYGDRVSLQFIQFLRPEMNFHNRDNLIMQLEQDMYTVRKILK
ncbi:MAG: riboflavin biosynthesis protein RibF [Solobacterium sp.]|jgi:riboflavin kinase/FMN adenylyltransferase|nr:riboflavin biosynthesis protein RibF [Solobacterium sp.]